MTREDLYNLIHTGTLCIVDRPDFLPHDLTEYMHRANGGDFNAAMAFFAGVLGNTWTWHVGYDNKADLRRVKPIEGGINEVSVISLSPAHALLQATVKAWML